MSKKKRSRMKLPKKEKDLQEIVEEVTQAHAHEHHHHHHHHHGEIDELLAVLELLVDSLNANIETLSSRVSRNSYEIARIYKILGHIVAYLAKSGEEGKKHLEEAIRLLGGAKEVAVAKQA